MKRPVGWLVDGNRPPVGWLGFAPPPKIEVGAAVVVALPLVPKIPPLIVPVAADAPVGWLVAAGPKMEVELAPIIGAWCFIPPCACG